MLSLGGNVGLPVQLVTQGNIEADGRSDIDEHDKLAASQPS